MTQIFNIPSLETILDFAIYFSKKYVNLYSNPYNIIPHPTLEKMEDEAEELVDKIRKAISNFDIRIADAVYDYYTGNEYNWYHLILIDRPNYYQKYTSHC